ncbi:MAG: EutN/CcmL family microcompartment protein [Bacillota bacterium]|nr:EutN/CcmL family microcompartment protein [Bacillota bacterium]
MLICEVQGKCVSTIKNKSLQGYSLIIVQKINKKGIPSGDLIVTIDTIGCSVGEKVLVTKGSSARFSLENNNIPIDSAVIGIIDEYNL